MQSDRTINKYMMTSLHEEEERWSITVEANEKDAEQVNVVAQSTVDPSRRFTCTFFFVDNQPYEPFCNPSRWKMLNERMSYKPSDILIVSYPKCGTTWMEQIVFLLLNNGHHESLNPACKNTWQAQTFSGESAELKVGKIWPDAAIEQDLSIQLRMGKQASPISWEDFENMPVTNRVLKSHCAPSMLVGTQGKGIEALPEGMKVIVVTRNPFDACVSSYFYGFNACRNGWPFTAWASAWVTGMVPMGSWFAFSKEWYEQVERFPGKSLWVHYEDLKRNPKQQIDRIAQYLQISATSADEYDELLDNVVRFSSFSSMKEQVEVVQAAAKQNNEHVDYHMRKGQCGDWKNFFNTSSALYATFVKQFHEWLDHLPLCYQLGEDGDTMDLLATSSVQLPQGH